jgi:hypothetical protein
MKARELIDGWFFCNDHLFACCRNKIEEEGFLMRRINHRSAVVKNRRLF